ncbi:hypothetical protein ACLOJK_034853, partial [Asimina triloba]
LTRLLLALMIVGADPIPTLAATEFLSSAVLESNRCYCRLDLLHRQPVMEDGAPKLVLRRLV